jgi:simple sugar transport system substrate-binding protein
MRKNILILALLTMAFMMVLSACGPAATTAAPTQPPATQLPVTQAPVPTATLPPVPTATPEPFVFGMLLVGPHNDQGWSQAHYDAGLYVEQKIPNSKMLYLENV